jgi:general secretion pathway protein H
VNIRHSATRTINQRGFTLIEVMVVVVIIGVLINYVTISFGRSSPQDQLNTEARRLSSLIALASEEALLRSALIGVDISEDGYAFLRLDEGQWQPMDDTLFRPRQLPQGMAFSIASTQQVGEDEEENIPEIILLNSGEMTPFELKLSYDRIDSYYRLVGTEMGERKLDYVSPY